MIFIILTCCAKKNKELYNSTQELTPISLDPPDLKRGLPVMEAFSKRASSVNFSDRKFGHRDLSDLLFAAKGINRKERRKRTAPSARNAQDIDIYVFLEEGVYFYDALKLTLIPVISGDHRNLIAGSESAEAIIKAPAILLLVSDISRFNIPERLRFPSRKKKLQWASIDAGLVSQNINIFCSGTGLITRPRISMDIKGIRNLLKLSMTQLPILNNAVGYPKE